MRSSRKVFVVAFVLLSAHALVLARLGTKPPGPLLSDLVQLALGSLCVLTCFQASRRSTGFPRSFWQLTALAFFLWSIAQTLTSYDEAFHASVTVEWIVNILFFFWFTPVGMVLFLEPESESRGFNWIPILDLCQAFLFILAAYLYFFYIPSRIDTTTELSHSVWAPYFAYSGLVMFAFLLRALLSRTLVVRALFGCMGIYFLVSGVADYFYYYGPGKNLVTGSWFDLVWSGTLVMPVVFAATWSASRFSKRSVPAPFAAQSSVLSQSFVLFYPLLVLVMSAQIARERVTLASVIVMASFACSSARLLLTQNRQQRSTQDLRRQTLAMETSPDGMAILNAKGEYTFLNRAHAVILGYEDPAALLEKDWRVAFSPEEVTRFENQILPLVARDHQWQGEAVSQRANGSTFPSELTLASLPDGGLVCVLRDISRRKQIEDRLRKSQRMEAIGKLAGGIAHDFNNLLTVIKGHSSLLLEHSQLGRSSVERIADAAERAAALTRQMLAFSRQQFLVPRIINLNSIVTDMDKMLRRLIGEDIQIVTCPPPDLGSVKADPSQLEQLIMNLVVNARDAMPQGGRITVETSNLDVGRSSPAQSEGVPPGRYVMLSVTDTGVGMDPEIQAHVFEPFFTTKEVGKGTGLGLSTVYGIVKQSGGFILLSSTPGRGTSFRVYLPRVDQKAEPIQREKVPASSGGTETILLVEDDRMLRDLVASVLTSCGYSILIAGHPAEAESLLARQQGRVQLLLTDLVMPGMNGKELAKRVTSLNDKIKVLYMSGYADARIQTTSDMHFIQKPFTPASLTAKIREILDQPSVPNYSPSQNS